MNLYGEKEREKKREKKRERKKEREKKREKRNVEKGTILDRSVYTKYSAAVGNSSNALVRTDGQTDRMYEQRNKQREGHINLEASTTALWKYRKETRETRVGNVII